MLPNDPMLALRAAQDTMAHRQYESSQERLAASARLAAKAHGASTDRLPKGFAVKSVVRPATAFVTLLLALSALIAASSASASDIASKRVVARSSNVVLDVTASRKRLLAMDRAGNIEQHQAAVRRLLSVTRGPQRVRVRNYLPARTFGSGGRPFLPSTR